MMITDDQLADLYKKEFSNLVRFCRERLGSNKNSEDIAQQSFLRLREMDIAEVKNLGRWLRGIARNLCREEIRKNRSERDAVTMWTMLSQRDVPNDLHRHLKVLVKLIKGMPKPYSKALQYVYIDGVPQKKAAEKMKMAYNKFRMVLTRGRSRLAEMFNALEELK